MHERSVPTGSAEAIVPPMTGGEEGYGIVVFSHLRWKFVWQRPQQFLSRFAENHPVLFIEEPVVDLAEGQEAHIELESVAENIVVAVPHFSPSAWGKAGQHEKQVDLALEAVRRVNNDGSFDLPLHWYYGPMEAVWSLDRMPNRGVVYDCMDELSQFKGAPAELVHQERRIMDRSDVVFTGGYELFLKKRTQHPNVHFFGCGVEYDHFSQAQDETTEIPADVRDLPRPIVGWFGVIDERVDYDLVKAMADKRPDWSFVMVGPVVKIDPESLPQAPNLHWLGGRDYKDLPRYCAAYDFCMMCFALNEATEFINPTKALEYLATGKPVLGTPVKDVVRQYSDLVHIERDADGFIDRIEKLRVVPDSTRVEQGIALARESSWERTVQRMQELIDEAIAADSDDVLLDSAASLTA